MVLMVWVVVPFGLRTLVELGVPWPVACPPLEVVPRLFGRNVRVLLPCWTLSVCLVVCLVPPILPVCGS